MNMLTEMRKKSIENNLEKRLEHNQGTDQILNWLEDLREEWTEDKEIEIHITHAMNAVIHTRALISRLQQTRRVS